MSVHECRVYQQLSAVCGNYLQRRGCTLYELPHEQTCFMSVAY
jgi:hypothetical protein